MVPERTTAVTMERTANKNAITQNTIMDVTELLPSLNALLNIELTMDLSTVLSTVVRFDNVSLYSATAFGSY
ncbi:hypothetical protein D3C80_1727580 [compost metagenome]